MKTLFVLIAASILTTGCTYVVQPDENWAQRYNNEREIQELLDAAKSVGIDIINDVNNNTSECIKGVMSDKFGAYFDAYFDENIPALVYCQGYFKVKPLTNSSVLLNTAKHEIGHIIQWCSEGKRKFTDFYTRSTQGSSEALVQRFASTKSTYDVIQILKRECLKETTTATTLTSTPSFVKTNDSSYSPPPPVESPYLTPDPRSSLDERNNQESLKELFSAIESVNIKFVIDRGCEAGGRYFYSYIFDRTIPAIIECSVGNSFSEDAKIFQLKYTVGTIMQWCKGGKGSRYLPLLGKHTESASKNKNSLTADAQSFAETTSLLGASKALRGECSTH